MPRDERRVRLDALRDAVGEQRDLVGGLVERRGVVWVSVGRVGSRRLVEVGCDFVRAGWWFTWSDGRPIAPVKSIQAVIGVLVRELADE